MGASGVRTVLMDAGPWLPVPPHGYGGLENVVATLVGGLREAGVRVVVAAAEGSTIACDELVTTVEPAFGLLGRPYTELVGRVHAHVALVAAHLRGRDDVDLVHTHTEVVGPAVLGAAGTGRGTPPVLHTLHWDPERQRTFYDAFDGRGCTFVNGVSAAHEARFPPALRAHSVGSVLLSTPDPGPAGADDGTGPVVVLGRITPTKGQDVALRAACAAGTDLVLAGPVGPFADAEALAAATARGPDGTPADERADHPDVRYFTEQVAPLLDERRRWVGTVAGRAKADLLRRAAALLMPVRWEEPGATVVVEALAAGTPVVALARGVLPELVEHGSTGYLADDEAELAGWLAKLDGLDRAACRAAWARRHTPAAMAKGYLALYAEVLRRSRRDDLLSGR